MHSWNEPDFSYLTESLVPPETTLITKRSIRSEAEASELKCVGCFAQVLWTVPCVNSFSDSGVLVAKVL
jgi:hypothetical protein